MENKNLLGGLQWIVASYVIFTLIIKGWVSGIFILSCLFSTFLFAFYKKNFYALKILKNDKTFFLLLSLVCVSFFSPVLVVLFTDTLKGNWTLSNYDGPVRYAFSALIFLFAYHFGKNMKTKVAFTFSLACIATLLLLPFLPQTGWSISHPGRLTSYFLDPLIFGQFCLLVSMVSLFFISHENNRSLNTLLVLSVMIGVYLSIESGSRTGWLSVPIIIYIYLFQRINFIFFYKVIYSLVIVVFLSISLYQSNDIIKSRINLIKTDIQSYSWNQMSPNSGVAERISYVRMGWYFFTIRPISGWQGMDFSVHKNDEFISSIIPQEVRDGVASSGFHSDLISNLVKYGFLGFLSVLSLFFCPLIFFIYCYKCGYEKTLSNVGVVVVIVQFISSLSHHILEFKSMATFYAMTIMIIMGLIANSLSTGVSLNNVFCKKI